MYVMVRTYVVLFFLCARSSAQGISTQCKQKNGDEGICEPLFKCQSAMKEIRQRITPVLCGFSGNTPIVCCNDKNVTSEITPPTNTRISEQYCREYLKMYTPNEKNLSIAYGITNANPKEFPHMVMLGYHNNDDDAITYLCGGTLISDQFVLTAAHCLQTRHLGPVSEVRLGEFDTGTDKDDAQTQDFKVVVRYFHPDYNYETFYNDIALLKLDRQVKFSDYVKPACLQTEHNFPGDELVATGWGALYYGGDMHNILHKQAIINLSKEKCSVIYKPNQRLTKGFDEEFQICGGYLGGRKDTCQGDSGGPLLLRSQDHPVDKVVGVTSFGKHCNTVPGIYTRVSKYIPWIESVVWPKNN